MSPEEWDDYYDDGLDGPDKSPAEVWVVLAIFLIMVGPAVLLYIATS